MTTLTSVELGASGRYINLGTPAALANLGDYTMLFYARPSGSQEAGLGYAYAKSPSSGAGPRAFLGSGGGSLYDLNGGTSSATSLQPYRKSAANVWTGNTWAHFGITFDGSLLGAGYKTYVGAGVDLAETAYGTTTNGTTALVDDSTYNANILNREGLGRAFVGDLAYFAIWDRVLTLTELQTAQNSGPLDVPTGLVLLWANQQDLGPNSLTPVSRSTFVAGSLPPNTALGSGATAVNLSGDAAAAATATGTLDVSSPASLSGDAAATAAAAGTLDKTATLAGDAQAQASAAGAVGEPALLSPENGTLDLANCTVTPNGTTPTITLKTRWPGENNTNGWRSMHGAASGMNGMTPSFRLIAASKDTNVFINRKPVYSYDGVTWYPFDNLTSDASYYYFSNNSAFTGDTVYFSLTKPFYHSLLYPWITSLEASGYVSETATSLGHAYEMGTRSATVNEQGKAIPAHPWYSFKISSGGLAPDGFPKRSVIITSGLHAAEDTGDWAMMGAVDFLVSADAKAVIARSWFDFYVYPLVASAGRKGGGARGDFQAGFMATDVNRDWASNNLETIAAHKAAFVADPATPVVFFLDFHSYFLNVAPYDETQLGSDRASWTPFITAYRAGISVTDNDLTTSATKWAFSNLGSSPISLDAEYALYNAAYTDPALWGADHMKALSDMAASNYWQSTLVDLAGAGLSVTTASGAMSVGINAVGSAGATANATGGLSLSIPLDASAVAQALAAAGLTHGTQLAGGAAAQGSAGGALTLNVSLAGNAIAQAAATGGLTATSASSMAADATAQAVASGALTHAVPLTGAALTVAAAGANITHIVPVAGAAAVAGLATGGLDVSVSLQSSALVQALADADITVDGGLNGVAGAEAGSGGTITLRINLEGNAVVQALASGALAGNGLIIAGTPGWDVSMAARNWRVTS